MAPFTRRAPAAIALVATLACTAVAIASEGDEQDAASTADLDASHGEPAAAQGPPELIKLYENEALGQLRLPGLWQVTDVDDGVRAVEPDQQRPAAIEIGTLRLPEPLPARDLAEAVATELGRALGAAPDIAVRQPAPEVVGDDKDADAFYLEIATREHDTEVRYAVLAVTGRKAAIIASLGAPAERFDELVPRQLLQDIVLSIE